MVKDNIRKIKEQVLRICAKINRDPALITIVAVSKNRSFAQIKEAIEAGIADIGENRVQEAIAKYNAKRLENAGIQIKWHMVGHLQTNKVKEAVKIFDLIQSVDSLSLAAEIDRQAGRIDKLQDILIEVKTSPEVTKFGLKPEEAATVIRDIAKFRNINIKGLMTIAPILDNPEETRPYFGRLRELLEQINAQDIVAGGLSSLSMGMSDDLEVAIEEGANVIRLGRAIFER
jgi:pyridoxal phosphate enzyme (YggS family)